MIPIALRGRIVEERPRSRHVTRSDSLAAANILPTNLASKGGTRGYQTGRKRLPDTKRA